MAGKKPLALFASICDEISIGDNASPYGNMLYHGDCFIMIAQYPHPAVLYLVGKIKAADMSFAQAEREAGIGKNTISRWLKTCRTPELDTLDKVLSIFNLRMGVMQIFP